MGSRNILSFGTVYGRNFIARRYAGRITPSGADKWGVDKSAKLDTLVALLDNTGCRRPRNTRRTSTPHYDAAAGSTLLI